MLRTSPSWTSHGKRSVIILCFNAAKNEDTACRLGRPRHRQVQIEHRHPWNTHMWRQPLLGRHLLHSDAWCPHQPSRSPALNYSFLILTPTHAHKPTPHLHTHVSRTMRSETPHDTSCKLQGRILQRILLQSADIGYQIWIDCDYRRHT